MAKEIFKEEHQYREWEVFALVGLFIVGFGYRFIEQTFFLESSGSTLSLIVYPSLIIAMIGIIVYLCRFRLAVRITDKSIKVNYSTWHQTSRKIKWKDIESCEVVKTNSAAQWSGYNVSFRHEDVYSLCGRNGLQLTTSDGEKIFIGSKKVNEISQVIDQVFPTDQLGRFETTDRRPPTDFSR